MPMATATMPPSPIGVSKQRVRPCFFCSPSVHAEHAAEIADVLAEGRARSGRCASITSSAELSAWIMFIVAIGQTPHLLALLGAGAGASP